RATTEVDLCSEKPAREIRDAGRKAG
ncbi:MAG: NADH dehydrogenase, partial [Leptospirillum sp. Group IV 'UBA BS']